MADLPTEIEIPYDAPALKCPVCEENIPVIAVVRIRTGTSRHAGTAGFRKPVINVSLDTDVLRFKIAHECIYAKPKGT